MFVVEGYKIIREIASGYPSMLQNVYSAIGNEYSLSPDKVTEIDMRNLKQISFLQNPKDALAVCTLPKPYAADLGTPSLLLDTVQDPGNLGTIIRLADWFGIRQIVCSETSADVYNPKVIQASMGSFLRVRVCYTDLSKYIQVSTLPVYAAAMGGENLYSAKIEKEAHYLFGNEGNGLQKELIELSDGIVGIPQSVSTGETESLNLATSVAVFCSEIFRRQEFGHL